MLERYVWLLKFARLIRKILLPLVYGLLLLWVIARRYKWMAFRWQLCIWTGGLLLVIILILSSILLLLLLYLICWTASGWILWMLGIVLFAVFSRLLLFKVYAVLGTCFICVMLWPGGRIGVIGPDVLKLLWACATLVWNIRVAVRRKATVRWIASTLVHTAVITYYLCRQTREGSLFISHVILLRSVAAEVKIVLEWRYSGLRKVSKPLWWRLLTVMITVEVRAVGFLTVDTMLALFDL